MSGRVDLGGPPARLTFELEELGAAEDPADVPVFLAALDHASPVVREGAIYGATHHIGDAAIRSKLELLSGSDPSAAVRAVAREALATDL